MPIPNHRKQASDTEFYCNSCRKFRPLELKRKRPGGGKTPICSICKDGFNKKPKKSVAD